MPGKRCLEVTVGSTTGLKENRSSTKEDPYAVVKFGSVQHKTHSASSSGMRPVWNHRFSFLLPSDPNENPQYLEVEIWDREPGNPDKQIGMCRVFLRELYEKCSYDSLQAVKRKSGKLLGHIRLHMALLIEETYALDWHQTSASSAAPNTGALPQAHGVGSIPPQETQWSRKSFKTEPPEPWFNSHGHTDIGEDSRNAAVGGLLENIRRALKKESEVQRLHFGNRVSESSAQVVEGVSPFIQFPVMPKNEPVEHQYEALFENEEYAMGQTEEFDFGITESRSSDFKSDARAHSGYPALSQSSGAPSTSTAPAKTKLNVPKPPPLDLSVVSNSSTSEASPSSPGNLFFSPSFAGLVSPALWTSLAPSPPVNSSFLSPFSRRELTLGGPQGLQAVPEGYRKNPHSRNASQNFQLMGNKFSNSSLTNLAEFAAAQEGNNGGGLGDLSRQYGLQRSLSSPASGAGVTSVFKDNEGSQYDLKSPQGLKRSASEELNFAFDIGPSQGGAGVPDDSMFWKDKRSRFLLD